MYVDLIIFTATVQVLLGISVYCINIFFNWDSSTKQKRQIIMQYYFANSTNEISLSIHIRRRSTCVKVYNFNNYLKILCNWLLQNFINYKRMIRSDWFRNQNILKHIRYHWYKLCKKFFRETKLDVWRFMRTLQKELIEAI